MVQAWNPSQICSNVVLSGANLIGTMTTNSPSDSPMYAVESVTTGRFYWEITLAGAIATIAAGIGNILSSTGQGQYLGDGSNTIGWFGGGSVDSGASGIATWATFASGNTLCFAMDLVSGKLWGRVGAAGNWNNDVIANQNPAVGSQVGGVAIPSSVTANAVVPAVSVETLSDTATGKFASASWIGTPPLGFGPFDASTVFGWARAPVSF